MLISSYKKNLYPALKAEIHQNYGDPTSGTSSLRSTSESLPYSLVASVRLSICILFNNVQVPHYNYVGDSILGYKSHMGAGSITSNVKSDKQLVVIKDGNDRIETRLKKVGAMLGDNVEIGCGSVLNPGTIIGRNSNVYPLSSVRGVIGSNSIYKKQGEVVNKIVM